MSDSLIDGWTNQVLIERQRERQLYYLPCYLRIKLKNFLSLSPSTRQAEINADLLFALHFRGLPAFAVQELQNSITLQFNRNGAITLTKSIEVSTMRNDSTQMLSFTLRKNLKCNIDANFFWAPFEMIYLALVVTVRSMTLVHPLTAETVVLRFNLMDHPLRRLKISLTREKTFGNYKLAPKKLKVFYSRELYYDPAESNREEESNHLISLQDDLHDSVQVLQQEGQEAQEEKLGYYQYAHFVMPMYRMPFVALFTIYFPLWSISLYSLFMYYQENSDYSMRIANGMVIIVTVFSYVPTIRDQLPSTPNLLLTEVLIYLISSTFIINLIQGYVVSTYPDSYAMEWDTDPYFIITLVINIVSVAIVLALSLLHKFRWEKDYLEEEGEGEPKLNRQEWKNQDCDRYFRQFPQVRPLNEAQLSLD